MSAKELMEEERVRSFIRYTGASQETALRFLRDGGWDIQASLRAYRCSDSFAEPRHKDPYVAFSVMARKEQESVVTIVFYRNGFVVEMPPGAGRVSSLRSPSSPSSSPSPRSKKSSGEAAKHTEKAAGQDPEDGGAAGKEEEKKEEEEETEEEEVPQVLELRDYGSAENVDFLRSVHRGMIPPELRLRFAHVSELKVRVVHREDEEFRPPPLRFSGHAQSLAASMEEVSAAASPSSEEIAPTHPDTMPTPISDTSAPSSSSSTSTTTSSGSSSSSSSGSGADGGGQTRLGVRLPDGRVEKLRVSPDASIADVTALISNRVPSLCAGSFLLCSAFPRRPLSDPCRTIAEEGLRDSVVIVQRRS